MFDGNNFVCFDFVQDWNTFLDDFSAVDFCLTLNETNVTTPITTENPNKIDNTTTTETMGPLPQEDEDDWILRRNISLSVMLLIDPSIYMAKIVSNVTLMSSLVPASLLGNKGIWSQSYPGWDYNIHT